MEDNKAVGIGSALLVVVIGVGIYFYKFSATVTPPVAPPVETAAPAAIPAAPPGEPLPKLEESDGFIRAKAASLSTDPGFAAWLKTDDILPRFVAAVNMIGKGKVPKDGLAFMAPHKKFMAHKRDGLFYAHASSYARYDAAAGVVASIDAAAAAKFLQMYRPLVQEAYQGLGEQKGDVRNAIILAAEELLKAPAAGTSVALKEKGIVYAYVDDSLENLSPAQKQLMRMGPKNEAKIQAKLREFVQALGGPDAPSLPK